MYRLVKVSVIDLPQTVNRVGNRYMMEEVEQLLNWLFLFLDFNFFTLIKFFDEQLDDDHLKNFYMEREWRVQTEVAFDLTDVRRVILPELYAAKLRQDIPGYMGQISFALQG